MTISSRSRRAGLSVRSSFRPRRSSRYSCHALKKNPPKPTSTSASSIHAPRPAVGAVTTRSFLEDLFGDDELHDLAGPLIDLGDLRVAVVALGREVFQIAIAPEDLHAIAAGFDRDVAGEKLRFGGGEDVILARVLQSRRAPGQQAGGVNLGRHVREHPLDRLEIGDRLAERLALLGVRQGVLKARARDPD